MLELDSLELGLDFRCPQEDLFDVFPVVRGVVRDRILEERHPVQMPGGNNSRLARADPGANCDFRNLKSVETAHSKHFQQFAHCSLHCTLPRGAKSRALDRHREIGRVPADRERRAFDGMTIRVQQFLRFPVVFAVKAKPLGSWNVTLDQCAASGKRTCSIKYGRLPLSHSQTHRPWLRKKQEHEECPHQRHVLHEVDHLVLALIGVL